MYEYQTTLDLALSTSLRDACQCTYQMDHIYDISIIYFLFLVDPMDFIVTSDHRSTQGTTQRIPVPLDALMLAQSLTEGQDLQPQVFSHTAAMDDFQISIQLQIS